MNGLKPFVERDMTGLENGPDLHGELPPTMPALVKAYPMARTVELVPPLQAATMRANGTVRPQQAFQLGIGRVFVMKVGPG